MNKCVFKRFASSCFPFILSSLVQAQSWISIAGGNEACISQTVLRNDSEIFKAQIVINGLYDEELIVNGQSYHKLSFDRFSISQDIGNPNLPVYTQFVDIPQNVSAKVSIKEEQWTDIQMGRVYPVQETALIPEKDSPFFCNERSYGKELFSSEILKTSKEIRWKEKTFISISVCPFKYYPASNKLSVLSKFTLFVEYSPIKINEGLNNQKQLANNVQMFLPLEERDMRSSPALEYLIIVGDILGSHLSVPSLTDFVEWKRSKGIQTMLIYTSTIIGNSANNIKSLIHDLHVALPSLKYVLLVGDEDKLPMKSLPNPVYPSQSLKSDYWYGCLDGDNDFEAEIAVGRFSTNDFDEIQNMVNKTIQYESGLISHPEKILLVAHKENPVNGFQNCMEYIRNRNYVESVSFSRAYGASQNNGGDAATNSNIINYINTGFNIINYHGHGEYNLWQSWNVFNEDFISSQINNMNESVCSVFLSNACLTGQIQGQTCMLETFTRSTHGAVAYLGATDSLNTYPNMDYNKYFFENLLDENVYRFGDLNVLSNIKTLNYYQYADIGKKTARRNALAFICGGDPTLEIWTDTIRTFNNVSLSQIGSNVRVYIENIDDFQVSVLNENGYLSEVQQSANHSCYINTPNNNSTIYINKHNYKPYKILFNTELDVVQNDTISENKYYLKSPIQVGYDVSSSQPLGPVLIKKDNSVWLNRTNGVTIKNQFKCEKGAILRIE